MLLCNKDHNIREIKKRTANTIKLVSTILMFDCIDLETFLLALDLVFVRLEVILLPLFLGIIYIIENTI